MEPVATTRVIAVSMEDRAGQIVDLGAADFDTVVRLYWPRIFRFALASLRDRDAAQTVAQDCFLKAYRGRERFRGEASLLTWLMQIAVNLVRDNARNRRLQFWRRAPAYPVDGDAVRNWIPDAGIDPEQRILVQEQVDAVWNATARLPERQRTVFLLRYVEEMELLEDRRRHRVERGSREDSSVPRAAVGAGIRGEVAMNDFRPGDFREAVARFRDALRQEGERSESPGLQAILSRDRSAKSIRPQWTRVAWAAAAVVALMLGAIPAYERRTRTPTRSRAGKGRRSVTGTGKRRARASGAASHGAADGLDSGELRKRIELMRTVIILTLSALMFSAVPALAQQAPNPCQAEEKTVARYKVLVQTQLVAQPDFDAAQASLAQCQARQARIEALRAEEIATQAKVDELRKRYTDSHPDVVVLRTRLDELRAQVAGLAQGLGRIPDAPASLKQSSGGLQTGLADRWWKNPAAAQYLGLTADQQKKMDDAFQQSRSILMNLNFTLEREEKSLERLVAAEPLEETSVAAQIDRVAQARAELEKANGRMLLRIRKQLTPEQWGKLNQISSLAQPAGK